MKLIKSLLLTGLGATLLSSIVMSLLSITYVDQNLDYPVAFLIGFIAINLTVGLHLILICVPIYFAIKNSDQNSSEEVYKNYLPISLIPFICFTVSVITLKPSLFNEYEFQLLVLTILTAAYFSYWLFIKSLKK